jgi:hypothetical protein
MGGWGGGARGYVYEKQVPSRICYGDRITWGYDIEAGSLAYCWTKLLLDKTASATQFDDGFLREVDGDGLLRLPSGRTAEQLVRDYLTQIYHFVVDALEKKFTSSIMNVTPVEFWFTMPALWSLRAQNATRDAAIAAGFGSRVGDSIHMIREPEAAAIACLNGLIQKGSNPLVQAGNGVLVCDCGGGTVASHLLVHRMLTFGVHTKTNLTGSRILFNQRRIPSSEPEPSLRQRRWEMRLNGNRPSLSQTHENPVRSGL